MNRPKKAAKLMNRQKGLIINIKEKIEVMKVSRKKWKETEIEEEEGERDGKIEEQTKKCKIDGEKQKQKGNGTEDTYAD